LICQSHAFRDTWYRYSNILGEASIDIVIDLCNLVKMVDRDHRGLRIRDLGKCSHVYDLEVTIKMVAIFLPPLDAFTKTRQPKRYREKIPTVYQESFSPKSWFLFTT
jgi:hypothetical protein